MLLIPNELYLIAQKDQADTDDGIIESAVALIKEGRPVEAIDFLLPNMGFNVSRDGTFTPDYKGKLSLEAWFDAFEIIEENYPEAIAMKRGSYPYYSNIIEQLRKAKSLMEQTEVATGHD